jgi:UPF0271 protein
MRHAVECCLELGVAIGAHPSYEDRAHFGRRRLSLEPAQVEAMVRRQVEALADISTEFGVRLAHVKAHGALYNQASQSIELSQAICQAVAEIDRTLKVVGRSGSCLLLAGRAIGLRTVSEVFCDRNYASDGSLVPRERPDAILLDPVRAAERVLGMLRLGSVDTVDGQAIGIIPETFGVHGDHPHALKFVESLCLELATREIHVRGKRKP